MEKTFNMIHSGTSKFLFNWTTIAYDCKITVIHNSSDNDFWIGKKLDNSRHFEIREGDEFLFKAGDVVKIYDPGHGSLVIKIERNTDEGLVLEKDGAFVAGSNVNRVCSSTTKQTLWRTTPIGVRVRVMTANGWSFYEKTKSRALEVGDVFWAPSGVPIGFKSEGIYNGCFMYDILAFENHLTRREAFAPEEAWSVNLNYNETLNVSHSINWAFQFYGDDPFLLEDGMKIDIDCNRKYRLMKSNVELPMTDFCALLKYKNVEVLDYEWGEKNLGITTSE